MGTAEVQRRNVERSAKNDAQLYQTKLVTKRRQVDAAVKQVEDQRAKVSALRDTAARHKFKGHAYLATLPNDYLSGLTAAGVGALPGEPEAVSAPNDADANHRIRFL